MNDQKALPAIWSTKLKISISTNFNRFWTSLEEDSWHMLGMIRYFKASLVPLKEIEAIQ